jgi:hypothetical protein
MTINDESDTKVCKKNELSWHYSIIVIEKIRSDIVERKKFRES